MKVEEKDDPECRGSTILIWVGVKGEKWATA